jgi:hypothetical protein
MIEEMIASRRQIYISKLKPVKDIEKFIIIILIKPPVDFPHNLLYGFMEK